VNAAIGVMKIKSVPKYTNQSILELIEKCEKNEFNLTNNSSSVCYLLYKAFGINPILTLYFIFDDPIAL
jgi:hypothetical protein